MTAGYGVGKLQEYIFAYNGRYHSLVFSHQGTLPRLYPRSAPDNLVRDSVNSDPIQAAGASQTFSPRDALQGCRTRSAPKFGFFFQVRVCVKRQISVFSPSVACGA